MKVLKRLLIPFLIGSIGLMFNEMICKKILPAYVMLDFPFLMTAFLAFFEESEAALIPVLLFASMRDIFSGGNGGSIFFSTLAFYFAARYLYRRFYVESELFLLVSIFFLMSVESFSVTLINVLAYDLTPSLYLPLAEIFRIIVNSLAAVPAYYWLLRRTGLVVYEL